MKLKAYAKINLTLDVMGKREDGFHLLDTVMQSVSLWDDVELRLAKEPGVRLRCSEGYLPTDQKNTAYRAAAAFLSRCGLEGRGLEIALEKRIPSRAGMGGGSADAAAVLHGLNRLFSAGLTREELAALGETVGADVPFCVYGGACRCGGTGEKLEPLPPMPDCFLLICKPPAGMSTPRAYARLDQYPPSQARATPRMVEALNAGDLRLVASRLANRFDETIRLMQVREIKRAMKAAGALGAMMTGSGSAVYGVFETRQAAQNCGEVLKSRGQVFLAQPLADFPEPPQEKGNT